MQKNYKDIDFNIINLFDNDQLKAGSVTFQMSQSLLIFQIIYFQNSRYLRLALDYERKLESNT